MRIAASIIAVAITCETAPNAVQPRLGSVSCGVASPVATSMPARNKTANGSPNRKRTCAAPTAPSAPMRSRCMALRSVCALDARSVNRTHRLPDAIVYALRPARRPPALVRFGSGRTNVFLARACGDRRENALVDIDVFLGFVIPDEGLGR